MDDNATKPQVDSNSRISRTSVSSIYSTSSVKHPETVPWVLYQRAQRRTALMLEISKDLLTLEGGLEEIEKAMIEKILELVECQYCVLLLADREAGVLRPLFIDLNVDAETLQNFTIPFGYGVSGFVYSTGSTVNVPDVNLDERLRNDILPLEKLIQKKLKSGIAVPIFSSKTMRELQSRESDRQVEMPPPSLRTHTSAVLSPTPRSFEPLKEEDGEDRTNVIGCLFLFNKVNSFTDEVMAFDEQDEKDAEALAVFCGIALDKASLVHTVREQRRRREIALDVLSYHNTAAPEMVESFMKNKWKHAMEDDLGLESLSWNPHLMEDEDLVAAHVRMLSNLGFVAKYEIPEKVLVRFLLTLGRNYRHRSDVAYHNFGHATAVTHGMYLLAKYFDLNSLITEELDIFALYLACATHDVDHRGTNNRFQQQAHTTLFEEYVSSTMEEHHANFSLTLITAPGHNILDTLPSKAFKRVISVMKRSIIATDLGLYFQRKPLLTKLIEEGTLDLVNDSIHRNLVRSLLMNCCDLSAMYRPFPVVVGVVDQIYEEFFKQGDKELQMGMPISEALMDRSKENEIPQQQVGFLKNVCEGQYSLLVKLLPRTGLLLDRMKVNEKHWQDWVDLKAGYSIRSTDIPWDLEDDVMPELPRNTWNAMATGSRLSAIDFRYKWIATPN
jgi:GAF domain-containing protein